MTPDSRQRLWARLALATGVVLLLFALRYTDWAFITANASRIIPASLAAVAISGVWHLARTVAWAACFPRPRTTGFARLFRVRIAAEAVSYVTVRGVAGEPLKVLLLRPDTDPAAATAAVALERLAYILFTTLIVGIGALTAWAVMPLSHGWRVTFVAFASGSIVIALGTLALLRGRGDDVPGSAARAQARGVRAFVAEVAARLRLLARGDRRRAWVLAATSVVCYACMALEAWAVFRIAGIPLSLTQAFAIETITRVASFASAFIPANLGALEAASLMAAAAAGAPGGAMLATARRLRGLFWAAVGFIVFPRDARSAATGTRTPRLPGTAPTLLLYIAEDPRVEVSPFAQVAGLPIAERVIRAARAAGYDRILVWAPSEDPRRFPAHGEDVTIVRRVDQLRRVLSAWPATARVTAIGPGTIASTVLLRDALSVTASSADLLDVAAGPGLPVSGVVRASVAFGRDLERLATALCDRVWTPAPGPTGDDVSSGRARLALRVPVASGLAAADTTMRRATYKDTDATLARFNRRMSLPISIALLRTPVTANMMSVFVFVLGMMSAWLFSRGEYVPGVIGGAISLAASILDGCDGEIARLKYQESSLGCWLETIGDYSYYLAVFVGLTVGAVRQTGWALFAPIGAMGLAGTVLSFVLLIFLRRTITQGRPETLHAVARSRFMADPSWWSRVVWRVSFVATRAAMPYGIFALAVVDLLPVVVVLSAVGANIYWVSLVLKLRDLLGEEEAGVESAERGRRLVPSA